MVTPQGKRLLNMGCYNGGGGSGGFTRHKTDTLLVVATLITTLSYQLGTNTPDGYWQDNGPDNMAGDPIMRDQHQMQYWLFMGTSWVGFASSMLLTLALLTSKPARSPLVHLPFAATYSSLLLAFITSHSHMSLLMDVALWVVVVAALTFAICYGRLDKVSQWAQGMDLAQAPEL